MEEEPSLEAEVVAIADIEAIKDMRLVPKTRKSYVNKNKIFLGFLRRRFPAMVAGDRIDLDTLTLEAFQEFIAKKQSDDRLSFSACSVRHHFRAVRL